MDATAGNGRDVGDGDRWDRDHASPSPAVLAVDATLDRIRALGVGRLADVVRDIGQVLIDSRDPIQDTPVDVYDVLHRAGLIDADADGVVSWAELPME